MTSAPLEATIPPTDVSTADPLAASSPQPTDSADKDDPEPNYEPVGNESDIQILVPQISVLDLDEFEEKPIDTTAVEAKITSPVKIKQEPKDDDEDDGFEDVGTFEVAAVIDDDSSKSLFPSLSSV